MKITVGEPKHAIKTNERAAGCGHDAHCYTKALLMEPSRREFQPQEVRESAAATEDNIMVCFVNTQSNNARQRPQWRIDGGGLGGQHNPAQKKDKNKNQKQQQQQMSPMIYDV